MKYMKLFLLVTFIFLLENVNPTSRVILGSGLPLNLRWNRIINKLQTIDVNPEISIKDLYQEIRSKADIDEDILFELSIGTQKLSKHDGNKPLADLGVGGEGSIIDITRTEKENQIKSLLNMFDQQVQKQLFGDDLYERMKIYIDSPRTKREDPSYIIWEILQSQNVRIFGSSEWNGYHVDDDDDIVIDALSVRFEHDISINSMNWSSIPSTIKKLQILQSRDNSNIDSLEINASQLTMLKQFSLFVYRSDINQIMFDEETVKAWKELERIEIYGDSLQSNSINIEQLGKFEKLKEIYITARSANHLQEIDINLLKDLRENLEELTLDGIKISNIDQIGQLIKLTYFSLNHARLESNIFDFAILESLKSLEILELEYIGLQYVNTTKLGELDSIETLRLTGNELNTFNTTSLNKLKRLKEIDLSENPLQEFNLMPLAKLTDLEGIRLTDTQITTLNLELFCKERPIKLMNDKELKIYIEDTTLTARRYKHWFIKEIIDPLPVEYKDGSGVITVLKKD